MIKLYLIYFYIAINSLLIAQDIAIYKIEPPNWWEGMKHNKIQIMVYGSELNNAEVKSENLTITKVEHVINKN